MKVAIIGSSFFDSLEFNLNEAFGHCGHISQIFDIYDSWYYKSEHLCKYTKNIDVLLRKYSDKYDKAVFLRLGKKVLDYAPDLVIGVYRFIHPDFVREMKNNKIKIIHINPDQLTTFEYQQLFVEAYHVYFTKDPYICSFMTHNLKLNVKLYNEAFNSRLHKRPNKPKLQCEEEVNIDVMTYGTMYPYRARMLSELLNHKIDLKVFGVKPHRFYNFSLDKAYQNKYIVGEEKAKLLYGSKIVFNQMHYAEIESVNNRFFEVNGSGAFQLSDYRPILNDLLPIDPELVSFKSIDEGVEKVKYYLEHPEERLILTSRIYDHFTQNYTYDHLIKYILKSIE